jgi:hypothetical protein
MNVDASLRNYRNPCFRYPALNCDGYYETVYNGTVEAVRPGALMAIPTYISIYYKFFIYYFIYLFCLIL